MNITNKPTPVMNLPENQRTRIWNINTNIISWIAIARYNMLMKASNKVAETGIKFYPDWARLNYKLDEFSGEKRSIFHIKTGALIDFMTVDLFDEIKRRNPVEGDRKGDDGKPYEYWKQHLATGKEVKIAIDKEVSPESKVLSQMQKQLDDMKALLERSGIKPFDENQTVEPTKKAKVVKDEAPLEEGEEGREEFETPSEIEEEIEEKPQPKKRGRKAKK